MKVYLNLFVGTQITWFFVLWLISSGGAPV